MHCKKTCILFYFDVIVIFRMVIHIATKLSTVARYFTHKKKSTSLTICVQHNVQTKLCKTCTFVRATAQTEFSIRKKFSFLFSTRTQQLSTTKIPQKILILNKWCTTINSNRKKEFINARVNRSRNKRFFMLYSVIFSLWR